MNTSKHHKLTNEVYTEILDVYKTLSEQYQFEYFSPNKLVIGLKALGMEPPTEATIIRAQDSEGIALKEFLKIITEEYIESSGWISKSMADAFAVFDKGGCGFVDPEECKRLFTKIGETCTDEDIDDQVKDIELCILVFYLFI